MKKRVRVIGLLLAIMAVMFVMLGCEKNKVTEANAEWVKVGYEYEIVIKRLGLENDVLINEYTYYWFNGAKNIEDAQKKLEEGNVVNLIVITFDEDKRASKVQFTVLTEQNKGILTTDVLKINLNVSEEKSKKIKYADSYYDIIDILGKEDEMLDFGDSECAYWFDGATSLEEASKMSEDGISVPCIEILFDNLRKALVLSFTIL